MLGDTRTAALVSENGSIDWMCVPRFDGDPLFGALIDATSGGRWSITPRRSRVKRRAYSHHAASLCTEWEGPSGAVVTSEGLIADVSTHLMPRLALIRRVTCTAGSSEIDVVYDPRLGLPGAAPERVRRERSMLTCTWGRIAIGLASAPDLKLEPGVPRTVALHAGETLSFALALSFREPLIFVDPLAGERLLASDDGWWRAWVDRFDYEGPHAEDIARSLLTLRLLTYAPSGAPVAAPTTSLPAPPGSDQTWDYRFSWVRDASIATDAFLSFGSDEEPRSFLDWLVIASRNTRPRVHVLYDLDGRSMKRERDVDGLSGYAGGKPVRVGNAAARQHQLDVYGWVLDAGWRMHEAGNTLTPPQWRSLRAFADVIAKEWTAPDNGIWEERSAPRHYVHSKLMAWAGLDKALRLAASYPARRRSAQWRTQRDRLAGEIRRRGYSERKRSYVRVLDGDAVDASALVVPALELDDDPRRARSTIDAVRRELGAGGPLVYRYALPEPKEGAFLPCSFWLTHALARTGRLDEAEEAFDELCELSTPLGLYAEQLDPRTRVPMGNYPQAFSHATFLQAAAALNEAREKRRASGRIPRARAASRPAFARRS
jgi:GH15 family glucan-1,4-alpha-glucosidase